MAVIGRQKLYRYLASQQVMPPSAMAMLVRAKNRALATSLLPSCWAMTSAIWLYKRMGAHRPGWAS